MVKPPTLKSGPRSERLHGGHTREHPLHAVGCGARRVEREPTPDGLRSATPAVVVAESHTQNGLLRIGIPKVLNLYAYAPLFTAYLTSLGVSADRITFSDTTTLAQFKDAVGFAAVDPCFPSKVCIAHVLNLLHKSRTGHKPDYIFFPMIDFIASPLHGCVASNACPAGAATPEAVKAAFSLSRDWFAEAGVGYLTRRHLSIGSIFALQMFHCWRDILGISWKENSRAVAAAFRSQQGFEARLRHLSRAVLDDLERDGRVGLVLLGRPYHHDPGLNQGILEAFLDLGYPCSRRAACPWMRNCSSVFLVMKSRRRSSNRLWIFRMCGRTRLPPTPTRRFGQPSSRHATPILFPLNFRTSNAGTTPLSAA